ncbi:MerR family transcriptional regulator [Virgibacillus sp. AGTR]|uniref:MerR family transcriptional regulator n=1 Tax=Virgibacillus sp. AGTR TaxID=2812055 RepID=UPI001965F927|nr:MerR family transcriptional regulator [Virgibacillus sp. AGTR]MCC2249899.1 MerR family transcriptional regulator [Virgibacillus sp. AGTR]QRZ18670.1 MerR family transcriptional regulator [Virgibacillus sp. AGTR]
MQIKKVAKQLNTTPRAIRFYEEKGLIKPAKLDNNEYRSFSEEDIARLSTILALREIGFSVSEISHVLNEEQRSISQYLNIQRSALYEKWLEMKDMIHTIDQMLDRTSDDYDNMQAIYQLATHLKNLKEIRRNWQDKWNFDSQAKDYDSSIKMHGYRFNVHQDYDKALTKVVETIQLEAGNTCLDIGIGTGNLGAKFLPKGINVIGIDQSENMLHVCKQKHPAIEIRKGHFLALPLMDQQVDGIVSSYALHHITDEEKILALQEMDRVLKAGGQICIADLMFINERQRKQVMKYFQDAGNKEAIYAIKDEYYADRSILIEWLKEHNYDVKAYPFNDILSMIYAQKTACGDKA